MSILETRREQPLLIIDVGDGFVSARAAPGSRRARPRAEVRARVLARVTAPAQSFDPAWQLVTTTTPGGVQAWFGRVRPDAIGRRPGEFERIGVLRPGMYDLELTAPGYHPTQVQAAIPDVGAPPSVVTIDLQPGPEYAFPDELPQANVPPAGGSAGPTLIRGQVLALDGTGLAGIPVQAPSATPAVTDRNGSWLLVFPDDTTSGPVTVTATVAGAAVTAATAVVAGQRAVVPQARLRGRAVRQSGAAVQGAAISVAGIAGAVASDMDGSWSLALPFGMGLVPMNVTVTAVLGPTSQTQAGIGVVPGGSVTVPDFVFPNP